jgi:tetratricopeptide (TPR) repeat protein
MLDIAKAFRPAAFPHRLELRTTELTAQRNAEQRRRENTLWRLLEIQERTAGCDLGAIEMTLHDLAHCFEEQGSDKPHAYEQLFKRRVTILEARDGPRYSGLVYPMNELAWYYRVLGRYADAEETYLRVYALREKHFQWNASEMDATRRDIASFYRLIGKPEKAEAYDPPFHWKTRMYWFLDRGRYSEAEPLCLRDVERARKKRSGDRESGIRVALSCLLQCYEGQDKYHLAEPLHREILTFAKRDYAREYGGLSGKLRQLMWWKRDKGSVNYLIYVLNGLATNLVNQSRNDEAQIYLQRVLDLSRKHKL